MIKLSSNRLIKVLRKPWTLAIVILGDLIEDLLKENYRNLRDILLTNSLHNIITVPTRGRALLDPVIVSDDLTVYDSGVLAI